MADLRTLKRPNIALIKLIECIGILLGVPRSTDKSIYKAPLPSNYDKTVELLSTDFYKKVSHLTKQASSQIPNDIAAQFYNKTLEPGFDYEEAVNVGGLLVRELFNIVYLVLLGLQTDQNRVPVVQNNISVLVDGTRPSYAALDTAAHVHDHGLLQIITITTSLDLNTVDRRTEANKEHLIQDLNRRCKAHYKKADHCYRITNLTFQTDQLQQLQIPTLTSTLEEQQCTILVLGLSDCNIGEDSRAPLAMWAAWEYPHDVILCKGLTAVRPFTVVANPRSYMLFLNSQLDPRPVFMKALRYLRPGDAILLYTLVDSGDPLGDNRDMRYDMGFRQGWVASESVDYAHGAVRPGWNDQAVNELTQTLEELLRASYLVGRVLVSRYNESFSTGQLLCETAFSEGVDSVLMGCGALNREVIVETIRESACSVILLK